MKTTGLGPSLSFRGNCWDNAPQESFFGHFKDETALKSCETLEDVSRKLYDLLQLLSGTVESKKDDTCTILQYRHHLLQVA